MLYPWSFGNNSIQEFIRIAWDMMQGKWRNSSVEEEVRRKVRGKRLHAIRRAFSLLHAISLPREHRKSSIARIWNAMLLFRWGNYSVIPYASSSYLNSSYWSSRYRRTHRVHFLTHSTSQSAKHSQFQQATVLYSRGSRRKKKQSKSKAETRIEYRPQPHETLDRFNIL